MPSAGSVSILFLFLYMWGPMPPLLDSSPPSSSSIDCFHLFFSKVGPMSLDNAALGMSFDSRYASARAHDVVSQEIHILLLRQTRICLLAWMGTRPGPDDLPDTLLDVDPCSIGVNTCLHPRSLQLLILLENRFFLFRLPSLPLPVLPPAVDDPDVFSLWRSPPFCRYWFAGYGPALLRYDATRSRRACLYATHYPSILHCAGLRVQSVTIVSSCASLLGADTRSNYTSTPWRSRRARFYLIPIGFHACICIQTLTCITPTTPHIYRRHLRQLPLRISILTPT
ncbi:hypothetical protein K438DRAFT_1972332 [Mycena galopus ATCC 62051]|nr:hypothetical protein K438DRAFT_1972332 [Mycena galopus ATCC 62051]